MRKFIPKYGAAAHLALLAVSPLFLFPYCGTGWTATVVLCLSLAAAIWMVMEPSRRHGETLRQARDRSAHGIFTDPLCWVLLLVCIFAAARWANGGIGMAYDAERMVWSMREPSCPFLPGSANGCGALEFAGAVGAFVIAMSVRHSLGRAARMSFLLSSAVFASIAAVIAAVCAHTGVPGAASAASAEGFSPVYPGTAFALYFLGGIVALAGMFELYWNKLLLLFSLSIGGCAAGAYFFLPAPVASVYAIAGVATMAVAVLYVGITRGATDSSKCAVALLLAMLVPVLLSLALSPGADATARFAPFFGGEKLVPDSFWNAREALSAVSLKAWKVHPWLGSGLGSFPLDIRFNALDADWQTIDTAQRLPLSGWWALMAERGILGALMFALPVSFMAWTFFRRVAGAFRGGKIFLAGCWLGLVAAAALVTEIFIDASFLSPWTTMPAVAFLAIAAASLPAPKQSAGGGQEPEGETRNS